MQRMFGVFLLIVFLFVTLPGFAAVSRGLDVPLITADNRQTSAMPSSPRANEPFTISVYLPAVQVAPSPTPVPTPSPVPTPNPTPDPKAARVRVDPSSGVDGTRFDIYGENFGAREAVDEWFITPDGQRMDDPTPQQTDGKGKFSSWVQMSGVSAGVYELYARGQTSGRQASTTFEIVAGQ